MQYPLSHTHRYTLSRPFSFSFFLSLSFAISHTHTCLAARPKVTWYPISTLCSRSAPPPPSPPCSSSTMTLGPYTPACSASVSISSCHVCVCKWVWVWVWVRVCVCVCVDIVTFQKHARRVCATSSGSSVGCTVRMCVCLCVCVCVCVCVNEREIVCETGCACVCESSRPLVLLVCLIHLLICLFHTATLYMRHERRTWSRSHSWSILSSDTVTRRTLSTDRSLYQLSVRSLYSLSVNPTATHPCINYAKTKHTATTIHKQIPVATIYQPNCNPSLYRLRVNQTHCNDYP